VLAEVGADAVPELLVVNKIDAADEETQLRLKSLWPDAVFASARTGAGIDAVRAAVEQRLPWPAIELTAVVPYERGDLVARVHTAGEVLETAHLPEGTRIRARINDALAAELAPFAVKS
jgi:GTP-binding protein HflX